MILGQGSNPGTLRVRSTGVQVLSFATDDETQSQIRLQMTFPRALHGFIDELIRDMNDPSWPVEVRSLGRTFKRWRDQIIAWHQAHFSNGPTEAVNGLVKRVKRVSLLAFDGSATTESAPCSTPASPTGTYSLPSHPVNFRSATNPRGSSLYARPSNIVTYRPV